MFYYNRIDLSEGTDVAKSITAMNLKLAPIGISDMGLSFRIMILRF